MSTFENRKQIRIAINENDKEISQLQMQYERDLKILMKKKTELYKQKIAMKDIINIAYGASVPVYFHK